MAVQTIKAITRAPWGERHATASTWYEPLNDPGAHRPRGALGARPSRGLPQHRRRHPLLPKVLDAAERFARRPADEEMRALEGRSDWSRSSSESRPAGGRTDAKSQARPHGGTRTRKGAVEPWCDPEVIERLLTTSATWAIVGLSANAQRTAYSIGLYLRDRLGMRIIAVNLRGEEALGQQGYRRLAEVPGPVHVVDCFVNSQLVGAVVDQAIAEKDRLGSRQCGFSSA